MREDRLTNRWLSALEYLRTHDVACPACGYNLRGNRKARCPECGEEFDPIELAEESPRIWSFGEVISCWWMECAVVAANVLAWIARHFLAQEQGDPAARFLLAFAVIVSIAAWDAARRDRSGFGDRLVSGWSFFSIIAEVAGLGLSRTPWAIVWVPLVSMILTIVNVAYTMHLC